MDPVQEDPSAQVSAIRDALLPKGFGVAWTSYSENGFAVKDGGQRVHQLRGLWNSNFGKPDRTYLVGQSMGALVALQLAEKHPGIYDGALPYCGMIGGSEFEARFVFDVRVLFDYYFPGVLPGDALNVPQGTDFSALVPAIIGSLAANPLAALEMAGVDQIELRFNDFNELVAAVLSPLGFHTIGVNDVLERTHGRNPIDNTNTVYTGTSNDAALNAGVDRFLAAPDAKNYLNHWYEPTGQLKVPVLTLHTSRDPLAPFSNEEAYAGVVSAAGTSDLLLQRTVDRFGHCTFAIAEIVAALEALVDWAETGIKPAGWARRRRRSGVPTEGAATALPPRPIRLR